MNQSAHQAQTSGSPDLDSSPGVGLSLPPVDRLLSTKEVLTRVRMGSTTLYRRLGEGKFPKPVRHGSVNLWRESAISSWIASLPESDSDYRAPVPARGMGDGKRGRR